MKGRQNDCYLKKLVNTDSILNLFDVIPMLILNDVFHLIYMMNQNRSEPFSDTYITLNQ